MSSSKKDYITKILSDKSPEYIKENFNYVVEMFEKDENEERSVLAEEAKTKSVSKDAKVPTSIVTESVKSNVQDYNPVTDYLSELKRS
jgi:hypothetical protein